MKSGCPGHLAYAPRCCFLLPFLLLILVGGFVSAASAADPVNDARDHALFLGAGIGLGGSSGAGEVVGLTDDSVRVLVDGKVVVWSRDALKEGRLQRVWRLSDTIGAITKVRAARCFAYDADLERQLDMQALLKSDIGPPKDVFSRGEYRAQQNARYEYFQRKEEDGTIKRTGSGENVDVYAERNSPDKEEEPKAEGPDALEFTCDIVAPRSARDAFLFLLVEYRRAAGEAQVLARVVPQVLAGVSPRKQRVRVAVGGFPPGYVLEKVQVHLFANGQEVATNLSERRVDLTADEALRLLTADYIASHPQETLPAAPQQLILPADFKEKAGPALLDRPVFATVGTDGTIRAVSLSASEVTPVDPYIDGLVRRFRFNPALKHGQPVESVVPIRLSEYAR